MHSLLRHLISHVTFVLHVSFMTSLKTVCFLFGMMVGSECPGSSREKRVGIYMWENCVSSLWDMQIAQIAEHWDSFLEDLSLISGLVWSSCSERAHTEE